MSAFRRLGDWNPKIAKSRKDALAREKQARIAKGLAAQEQVFQQTKAR